MNLPACELIEFQSPVHGRRASPAGLRSLDPLPIAKLRFASGQHDIQHRRLFCTVDLFRVPDSPPVPGEYTYYSEQGTGHDGLPIFCLFRTRHPPNLNAVAGTFGSHLFFESSAESHLLVGQQSVEANLSQAGEIVFLFPNMGVLQTGSYLLRYSVYIRDAQNSPCLKRCLGAPFRISPPGQFSGLMNTTPLTNSLTPLNIAGVRRRGAPA
ncbi:hypothetical protein FB451DRAFT_1386673 [Mycena latifolia]|nr:hypothetical protein FB451DRAFT_1386673 [Mycena latifolia]